MVVLLSRILLAVIFGVSATAKLGDRGGSRRAITEFGLPADWARPLATLVPVAELASAGALLIGLSSLVGAAIALTLLSAFTIAIVGALIRGKEPNCHCFGGLSGETVGWSSVARNAFFGTLATLTLVGGRSAWLFVILALVSLTCWLGPPVRRRWVERVGKPADGFVLPSSDGEVWTLDGLLQRGRPVVLIFSSSNCGGCDAVMPDIARWQQTEDARLTVAVLSGGPPTDSVVKARHYGLRHLLIDEHRTVFRSFGVTVTPTAVLLGSDGMVAAAPALGSAEIESLVAQTLAAPTEEPVTRRVALQRFATGMGVVLFAPLLGAVAAACGSTVDTDRSATGTTLKRRKQVEVDDAWLCDQRYALCTTAACEPSPSDPSIAICRCFVLDGYSMGFSSCEERSPSGSRVVSTFSTQNVSQNFGAMTCPESARWANCLDVTCEVDPKDRSRAVCQCPIVDSGPSVTFGGDCETKTCTSVIWSAATPPGLTQYGQAMQEVGSAAHFPRTCPS